MSDSNQNILIGVDGGGTGCRVAFADLSGRIIAQAKGGPANVANDPDGAVANILAAISDAAETAGIAPDRVAQAVVHAGLAGVLDGETAERVRAALPFPRCTVTEDIPTAIAGALGGRDGYLVALGTGTIVAASLRGQTRHVGGWGLSLSDQASGAWLGRGALEQTLLAHDGVIAPSGLTRDLLGRFGDAPLAIVEFARTASPGDYAALAPAVVEAAQTGDAVALDLMGRGAAYLERALAALGFQSGDALCLSGGVGPFYAPHLAPGLTENRLAAHGSALDGAILLAAAAARAGTA